MVSVDDRPARGLKLLAARLDARSVRERALAFVVALALVLGGWDGLLLAPLDTRRAALQQQVPDLETRLATLDTLTAQLLTERQRDPDAVPRAELDRLRRAAGRLDTLLVELTERLVPPRHMAAMLESVLTRETDLTLTRLAGLGVEPVVVAMPLVSGGVEPGPGAVRGGARASAARDPSVNTPGAVSMPVAASQGPRLYRHGLRIEFEGGYLQTLAYLHALESLDSRFLWRALEFDMQRYPLARVSMTVYSLSLDDAWIGI